jgi:hypothetical protein
MRFGAYPEVVISLQNKKKQKESLFVNGATCEP